MKTSLSKKWAICDVWGDREEFSDKANFSLKLPFESDDNDNEYQILIGDF